MAHTRQRALRPTATGPTAVAVRLMAFFLSLIGIAAIPVVVFAMTTGRLTLQTALFVVCGALVVVSASVAAVRPFDPFRR